MKLNKLVIQNFLSIQNATLYLADKGLVSIEGTNEDETGSDSNGSGKSSIINSILWCLYGVYGKEGRSDDVVNSRTGKNCLVQTEWREGANSMVITRARRHGIHNNSIIIELNGRNITKAGAEAAQQQINELMGANEIIFRASCFAQQENPLDIPAMTDSKLKALLEEVLPFDNLVPLHEKATKVFQDQRAVVETLAVKIYEEQWKINHTKKELKQALDARFKWADEIDSKSAEIDKELWVKTIQRGIALGNSSNGELKKEIESCSLKINLIGHSNVELAAHKHGQFKKLMNDLKSQLQNPVNTCAECGQEVEDLEAVKARTKVKLAQAEASLDDAAKQLKEVTEKWAKKQDLQKHLRELELRLDEANRNSELAYRLEAEISLLQSQKAVAGGNPHNEAVTRLRGDLKAAVATHKELSEQLKEAEAHLEVLKAVQLTYSPKGLRYHMLERLAPQLTDNTNRYLQILTDGAIKAIWSTVSKTATGDYKEKFSIEAKMDNRTNFGLLSGGEKRKVRLACFFALQDLIASQASKNIELWAADEIDVALDGAGMERLMGVLAEKIKTKSTILVISHNQIREWFPNYATVTRKDGVSTITGYLSNVD